VRYQGRLLFLRHPVIRQAIKHVAVGSHLGFCSVVRQNSNSSLGELQGVRRLAMLFLYYNRKCKEAGDVWFVTICKGIYTATVHAVM